MRLNIFLDRNRVSILTLSIIASMTALVVGYITTKKELVVYPSINNSIVQALILTLTASLGYLFVMKFGQERKILKEELRNYERRVEEYKSKVNKEKKVENELKKELMQTKATLNRALMELDLKGTKLHQFNTALKKYEQEIESVEEIKNLYEGYITWQKKIKEFFEMFLINSEVYVEEKENVIMLRTDKESDIKNVKGPFHFSTSIKKEEVKDQIMFLIRQGVIMIKNATPQDKCDYILSLTEKGKRLRNSLVHISLPRE